MAESLFKSLQCELTYGTKLRSADQMELEIFEYIERWYTKCHSYSALCNMTIDEFLNNIKPIDSYKKVA